MGRASPTGKIKKVSIAELKKGGYIFTGSTLLKLNDPKIHKK